MQYLPISPLFFSLLVALFLFVFLLIQLEVLNYAYMRLGMSSGVVLVLLFGSLLGSYFNIPVVHLAGQPVGSGRVISFFGMDYVVPVVVQWPGTVIAVNVGGALIPSLMSAYLLIRHRLWVQGALAVIAIAAICHWLAQPVPGLGIAVPIFVPAIATAIVALLLSRQYAAQLAYIGGSLGTLVGADLLNIDKLGGLGAPIASIGGAGTFDGIFVTGVLAVLLASLPVAYGAAHSRSGRPGA